MASPLKALVAMVVLAACSRSGDAPKPTASAAPARRVPAPVVASAAQGAPAASSAASNRCLTPESVGATPLPKLVGANAREQQALVAARAELRRVLEDPAEFFANVQATDDVVLIELWHRSAFLPENCGVTGNPGDKCRTLAYDPTKGRITSTKFWQ
jgi:hypothetical protein